MQKTKTDKTQMKEFQVMEGGSGFQPQAPGCFLAT